MNPRIDGDIAARRRSSNVLLQPFHLTCKSTILKTGRLDDGLEALHKLFVQVSDEFKSAILDAHIE